MFQQNSILDQSHIFVYENSFLVEFISTRLLFGDINEYTFIQ